MTAIDPPLTLQVSDDDKVLEPYRLAEPSDLADISRHRAVTGKTRVATVA